MNSEIVTDTPIGDCNIFDRCVSDLESNGGYALLPLWTLADSQQDNSNDAMPSTISRAFSTTISAMDAISASLSDNQDANVPLINPDTDSGSWTGYHHAASKNGRYNEFREGFVFSNGDMFDVTLQDKSDNSSTTFQHEMNGLFNIMHNVIATGVLSAIERRLELPINYFANELGPTSTSSQWHMKRYAVGDGSSTIANEHDKGILLPVHTDPSLISVVIMMELTILQWDWKCFIPTKHHYHTILHHSSNRVAHGKKSPSTDTRLQSSLSEVYCLTSQKVRSLLQRSIVWWNGGQTQPIEKAK